MWFLVNLINQQPRSRAIKPGTRLSRWITKSKRTLTWEGLTTQVNTSLKALPAFRVQGFTQLRNRNPALLKNPFLMLLDRVLKRGKDLEI